MKKDSFDYNFNNLKQPSILLFLVGFLLYANTLNFEYVLDDKIVITGNQITKKGFAGILDHFKYDSMDGFWAEQYGVNVEDLNKKALVAGGRYRPLTLASHAIEYEIVGESPGVSHFINALLYGLTAAFLFIFLSRLLKIESINKWWFSIPFLITLIYITHPLHVEVVANVKGRDEILSFLLGIIALDFYLQYVQREDRNHLILGTVFFFSSLLAKETTITFVAVIPLMLYFFTHEIGKKMAIPTVSALGASVIYLLMRHVAIGELPDDVVSELMNNPFLEATGSERLATVLLTTGAYFKLLIYPNPLTHDYYPFHLPFMSDTETYPQLTHPVVLVTIILLIGLITLSLIGLKSKKIYSFAILFFLGNYLLVSNLLFPIGVFMNERFMYIPSLGFSILLVWTLVQFLPQKIKSLKAKTLKYVILGIALVFSILSVKRNYAWESDEALAMTDVKISTGSAKANMSAGDSILKLIENEKNPQRKKELINEAFGYLSKSLTIYPGYFPPNDLLGKLYFEAGNYTESARFYARCFERKPNDTKFVQNILFIGNKLVSLNKYQEAVTIYQQVIQIAPSYGSAYKALGELYGNQLQNAEEALKYLSKANELLPNNYDIVEKLGICHAMLQQNEKAIELFNNALKLNPNNPNVYNNMAAVYNQMGDLDKAKEYMQRSLQLKQQKN